MKILYGIQGTGNGHLSRGRALVPALRQQGVQVDVICSGRNPNDYFDMQIFGRYQTRRGLSFVSQHGKIALGKTIRHNHLLQLLRDIQTLDLRGYDLVLSDFEPVSAWAAQRAGVPSLTVSHQAAFQYPILKEGDSLFNRQLMRHFAPVQQAIGLHWFHHDCQILPPIIDSNTTLTASDNGQVLVYLPFENLNSILHWLSECRHARFDCFHPAIKQEKKHKNIGLYPLSHARFRQALASCHGVIANAGFELPSEAMALGKKLLVKPLQGQFEQQSNALTLDIMGLATRLNQLDQGALHHWLHSSAIGRVVFPDVASAVATWVAEGASGDVSALKKALWSSVEFPESVVESLQDCTPLDSDLSLPALNLYTEFGL